MKKIIVLALLLHQVITGISQSVAYSTIKISCDKTTSLIFPAGIRKFDKGTSSILSEFSEQTGNLLLLKAAKPNFPESNLSVITADGRFFTFTVAYQKDPDQLLYNISEQFSLNESKVILPEEISAQLSAEIYSKMLLTHPKQTHSVSDESWDVKLALKGIYINGGSIFYQLQLENTSTINYDIDLIRFYIRDTKKQKRSAVQEIELKPLFVAGRIGSVNAQCKDVLVLSFNKFTIPKNKYLAIEVMEKNGGRNLFLKVSNKKIVKASILPDLD